MDTTTITPTITPTIERWLAALREGDVQQGQQYLRRAVEDDVQAYCCLGIACELSDMGAWAYKTHDDTDYVYVVGESEVKEVPADLRGHVSSGALPVDVQQSLGLRTNVGDFTVTHDWWKALKEVSPSAADKILEYFGFELEPDSKAPTSLAGLNDNGLTFMEIADVIESEPPGLFG